MQLEVRAVRIVYGGDGSVPSTTQPLLSGFVLLPGHRHLTGEKYE